MLRSKIFAEVPDFNRVHPGCTNAEPLQHVGPAHNFLLVSGCAHGISINVQL